jgi:hypothetical protein
MKKYILSIIAISILSSGVAGAQNSSSTIKLLKENIKQERMDIRGERASTTEQIRQERASTTNDLKNKRVDIKSQIEKIAQEKMNLQKNAVVREFDNALSSLNNLATRTDSRIAKLVAQGINMSSSTSLLNIAKTDILNAQTEINTLKSLVTQITATTTPKALKAQIKNESAKAKALIQIAKRSLSATINSVARSQVMKKVERNESVASSTTKN